MSYRTFSQRTLVTHREYKAKGRLTGRVQRHVLAPDPADIFLEVMTANGPWWWMIKNIDFEEQEKVRGAA